MPQVETLPQSIADVKTVVLKPRLDCGDIQLIGEKIKPALFTRFGFKINPKDVRLLATEIYFEPYLVIEGKYVLDYCRKHLLEANVEESTTKIFVAGQEFRAEKSDPKLAKRIVKMLGEEHAHHERQSYFVLDRMKREVPPERLHLSPFVKHEETSGRNFGYKNINISDEAQIEFLRKKLAQRPADVAEIVREVFDIVDRTIVYCPMYQLTFESARNREDAIVTVDGITGEITLNGTKKLAVKTIVTADKITETELPHATINQEPLTRTSLDITSPQITLEERNIPEEIETRQQNQLIQEITPEREETKAKPITAEIPRKTKQEQRKAPQKVEQIIQPRHADIKETIILGFPAKIYGKVFAVDDHKRAVVGDIEIPSGTKIDKTLIVKGSLRIGDNCRVHGKLKALKDITVGADTIIDGDVVSGGNIFVGPRSLISGTVKAAGVFEIEETAVVEGDCTQTVQS